MLSLKYLWNNRTSVCEVAAHILPQPCHSGEGSRRCSSSYYQHITELALNLFALKSTIYQYQKLISMFVYVFVC